MKIAINCLLAVMIVSIISGCGYSTGSSLDEKYRTIHIVPFENQTGEYDLQAPLTNAVIRKFINDPRLRIVDRKDADLLMEGVILKYQLKGLTYDRNDEVTQFLCGIVAGVRLTDQISGEVFWEETQITGETSFYTRASGQSSDRLRGNAEVFLPTVRSFDTEEENRGASEAIEQLASDIFYRTIVPW